MLVGMYTSATPMETYCGGYSRNLEENCYVIHYPTSRYIVKGNEIIVAALFTVALVQEEPEYLSTGEWIKTI